jgi:hypothetical protein
MRTNTLRTNFYTILFSLKIKDVTLSPEHLITVEQGQDNPLGPQLEPIDPSFIGKNISLHTSSKANEQERLEAKRLLDEQLKDSMT